MDKDTIKINGDGTPYREPELIDRVKLLETIKKVHEIFGEVEMIEELEDMIQSMPQHSTGAHVHIDIEAAFERAVEEFKQEFSIVQCADCVHRPKLRTEKDGQWIYTFVEAPISEDGICDTACPFLCYHNPRHNEMPPADFWCQKGEKA